VVRPIESPPKQRSPPKTSSPSAGCSLFRLATCSTRATFRASWARRTRRATPTRSPIHERDERRGHSPSRERDERSRRDQRVVSATIVATAFTESW